MLASIKRPCVLVFAGHDPSGGAGIQADIEAIAAHGVHALPVITALTVQDNNQVYQVHAVAASIIGAQTRALLNSCSVGVVKIGIVGCLENAQLIADLIREMQSLQPELQVVLDPVLASGRGNKLTSQDAVLALAPLMEVATLITPNLPEVARLASHGLTTAQLAQSLLGGACRDVLLKGGHAEGNEDICNRWFNAARPEKSMTWFWRRLAGEYHGSGCTLAAAIAANLALGFDMEQSLLSAQSYTQRCLENAFSIAEGQFIPQRFH
jgi:hydroxymethylpyrimidine/phosphomethylpyrimidine kinase